MPALWESSQRPMFVRTVWVGGVRHAILTKDDPLLQRARRRPVSSVSYSTPARERTLRRFKNSRLSHNGDELEECFRKLQLVINKDKTDRYDPIRRDSQASSVETPVDKLDLEDIESISEEELVLKASAQPLYEFDTSRSKFHSLCVDMRPVKPAKPAPSENHEKCDLSERVFQWLDLAGKVDLLTPEADNRMAQPRHSCPEIQKRVHQLLKKTPEPKIEPKFDDRAGRDLDIDPPSRVIESYARQTRHARERPPLPRSRPVTHKLRPQEAAKPINAVAVSTEKFLREMDANFATRQQVVSEIYDVERQYAQLMGRGGADTYSRQFKRQVHIFMPPLPKKGSAATSRTESLLSQAS